MRIYKYVGLDARGYKVEGTVEGKTKAEAVKRIRADTVTKVTLVGFTTKFSKKGLTKIKLSVFLNQLAYLLDAGIPMHKAIESLSETGDIEIQRAATQIHGDIIAGKAFSAAFHGLGGNLAERFFPQLEAGERGANLESVMKDIAVQLKKESKNARSVKTAMIYPVFILIMALGIAAFLLTSVVPDIASILYELGGTLPYLTRLLMSMSDFLVQWGVLVFIALGTGGFAFYKFIHGKGKLWWDSLLIKVPIVGEMLINQDQINFYRSLYHMMNAGIPYVPSLKYSYATVENLRFRTDLETATTRIQQEGIDLASAMRPLQYIAPIHLQALRVGIESNKLPQTLHDTSDTLEEDNAEVIERFKAMLNPLLMIVVGIVCGFIMFAMYLPMFTVMGNL